MPSIYKRPLAQEDLTEIWEYMAEDSANRADAFIDTVEAKLRALAVQPTMGGRARDELAAGLRSFPIGRYVVFYEVVIDGIALGARIAWCSRYRSAIRGQVIRGQVIQ